MGTKLLLGVVLLGLTGASQAALLGRLPVTVGGTDYQAYYDTVLDITWLADANAGAGSAFDDGFSTTDGLMTWDNAVAWTASLDINGVTGWRLPSMDVNGDHASWMPGDPNDLGIVNCSTASEMACRDNELGYMYYHNLAGAGNLSGDQDPFTNILFGHLSGTEIAPAPDNAWVFDFGNGVQGGGNGGAWAVRSGDVAVVPLPAGIWLLGSGLLGLAGLRRR